MSRREEGRILMLVDDEHTRLVCSDALTHEGHDTIVVSRGEEALGYLEREDVEIFVVELPGPGGDDRMGVLSALRQRALQPLPAIVAVTQSDTSEFRRDARAAGVIDFLSRPVEPVELACRVQSILELRRLRALAGWRERLKLERHAHCCSLVSTIAEGIATIDADDRLDFVNPTAAGIFGYTIDEVVGRPVIDFVADEQWRRVLREKLERVHQGLGARAELLVRRKDGTTMWILATATPLPEPGRYIGAVIGLRDITLRRNAEDALRQSEQRMSLATAAAEIGLWDWDLVTDAAHLSPGYVRMLGGQETEIRSARAWFEQLLHPDDRTQVMQTMERHLQGEIAQSVLEYRARQSSGDFIWLRGIGRVVDRDQAGAPLRMTGVVVDISEQKHTEDLLRAAIATRDNVLAIAAHDLRNPLAAIHLSAELLTERPHERDRRKSHQQLEVIRRSAAYMQHLIEKVLDAATIEAGTFTLTYASEDLEPLVDELFQESAAVAARKSIHLVRDVLVDLPPIWCDGTRLREVLSNLIGNALKFVPENGTVRLRLWAQGGDVHFEVADNGPGIPEQSLSHLFDRYWTGDGGRRRGAGLGLFISKGIVDAHHGHIFVESEIGVGTTFHFTIPMKPQESYLVDDMHARTAGGGAAG